MIQSIKRTLVASTLAVAFAVAGAAVVATPAQATTPCVKQVYAIGNAATCVKHIQALLNFFRVGTPLRVDGKFGPATRTAVMTFQTSLRLTVDGNVGPKTWNILCYPQMGPGPIAGFPYANAHAAGCPGM